MAHLVDDHVRIGDFLANDKGTTGGELVGFEVSFQGLEEVSAVALGMFRVGFVFVGGEESLDEERTPCDGCL